MRNTAAHEFIREELLHLLVQTLKTVFVFLIEEPG